MIGLIVLIFGNFYSVYIFDHDLIPYFENLKSLKDLFHSFIKMFGNKNVGLSSVNFPKIVR